MIIRINNLQMSYRGQSVEKVQVSYRVTSDDEDIRGNGRFTVEEPDYDGTIKTLENLSKEHFIQEVENMDVDIRATNMNYKDNQIESVKVHFRGNHARVESTIDGKFIMGAESYEENSTMEALEKYTREYVKDLAEQA